MTELPDNKPGESTAKIAADLLALFPDSEKMTITTPTDSPVIIESIKNELVKRGLKTRLVWRRKKKSGNK